MLSSRSENIPASAVSGGCISLRIWKDAELGTLSSCVACKLYLNKIVRDEKRVQTSQEHLTLIIEDLCPC